VLVEHGSDREPDSASPRSGARLRKTAWRMRLRSRSVAASNASRLRLRSAASNGLRHTIKKDAGFVEQMIEAHYRSQRKSGAPLARNDAERSGVQK